MFRFRFVFFLLIFVLVSCQGPVPDVPTVVPPPPPTPTASPEPVENNQGDEEPIPELLQPTEAANPEPTDVSTEPESVVWPPPIPMEEALARTEVTIEEQAAFDLLAAANFGENDPIALAVTIAGKPQVDPDPVEPQIPTAGTVRSFWVHNVDTNAWTQIDARLERVTEHAYFWFDTSTELKDASAVDRAAEAFEGFYEAAREIYGEEPSPGIDGDPRVYVLHASAVALCDVDESTTHQCGLLGYFSTTDAKPVEIDEHSNEHEMFVLNIDRPIGGQQYISTLVHEFRHMIEHNYDRHDDDWEVEGTAVMAQLLVGDVNGTAGRADAYVDNTDLQMNAWTQGNTNPHYGKGYVFSRYIFDRMGQEFYSAWVRHPDRAFFAIDAVLDEFSYDFSAVELWVDFTAAVALIGVDGAPDPYRFSDSFEADSPATTSINKFPSTLADTVSQYGFDIYTIRGEAPVEIEFTGTTKVPVLENVLPASGQYMWWSGRANQSDMSLTREVDLTSVSAATLNYDVYFSIEKGYDFGYVLISTDGGVSWEHLASENMQGENESDDPGEFSLAERFYSGRGRGWFSEIIDLSPYAGQLIQLRFQYITDAIYTSPGLAVDNISIPEIGFFDDVEAGDTGWTAAGFLRVNAYVPQEFHVVMMSYDESGALMVERIPLAADNSAAFAFNLSEANPKGYLVVTATNPLIMTPASYSISTSP